MSVETKRSTNFNSKEESTLLYLVKKYKGILENKKTDSNINKQKSECWRKIEVEFNSESGEIFRDANTLKKKYENLKKRTKKKVADERCYIFGTGGGPAKKPPEVTDIDIEIKEILGDRITGLPSEFDGDAEIITIINEHDYVSSGPLNTDLENFNFLAEEENAETSGGNLGSEESKIETPLEMPKPDWSRNSIQNMRTPKSSALTIDESITSIKRKRNEYDAMCSKVSHWAASKSQLETEKIRLLEEEHAHKMKLMEEKLQKEYELTKKESETRIKKIEQEMEVTVEGIREQNKLKKEILLLEKHILLQKLKNLKND